MIYTVEREKIRFRRSCRIEGRNKPLTEKIAKAKQKQTRKTSNFKKNPSFSPVFRMVANRTLAKIAGYGGLGKIKTSFWSDKT